MLSACYDRAWFGELNENWSDGEENENVLKTRKGGTCCNLYDETGSRVGNITYGTAV